MAAEPKTKPTKESVTAFVDAVPDETRRKDAKALLKLFREVTGEKPVMWGPSIIGYGSYQSPTGPWPRTGFSPRKAELVLYVLASTPELQAALAKLGKHRTGKSCLYVKKLADVDMGALKQIVAGCWAEMARRHPERHTGTR